MRQTARIRCEHRLLDAVGAAVSDEKVRALQGVDLCGSASVGGLHIKLSGAGLTQSGQRVTPGMPRPNVLTYKKMPLVSSFKVPTGWTVVFPTLVRWTGASFAPGGAQIAPDPRRSEQRSSRADPQGFRRSSTCKPPFIDRTWGSSTDNSKTPN